MADTTRYVALGLLLASFVVPAVASTIGYTNVSTAAASPVRPLSLEVLYNVGNEARRKIGEIMRQQYGDLDVPLTPKAVSWSEIYRKVMGVDPSQGFVPIENWDYLQWDMCMIGWVYTGGPDIDLYELLHSAMWSPYGNNLPLYNNSLMDALLEEAVVETNTSRLVDLYRSIQLLFIEDAPYIPLYFEPDFSAFNTTVVKNFSTDYYEFSYKIRWLNASTPDGRLVIAQTAEPSAVTPLGSNSYYDFIFLTSAFDSLFYPWSTGWANSLLLNLEVSVGNLSAGEGVNYTVVMRTDVPWVNRTGGMTGVNTTVDDLIFSFAVSAFALNLGLSSPSPASNLLEYVQKINNSAAVFHISEPYFAFLDVLAGPMFTPINVFSFASPNLPLPDGFVLNYSAWRLNASEFNTTVNQTLGGCLNWTENYTAPGSIFLWGTELTDDIWFNGPFYISDWDTTTATVTLDRNPHYPVFTPQVNKLVFATYGDDEQRRNALLTGEVHLIRDVPYELVNSINTTAGYRVDGALSPSVRTAFFNCQKGLLRVKEVRQALIYGLDRQGIITAVTSGYGRLANSLIPPNNYLYATAVEGYYPYNPTKAKQLLDQVAPKKLIFVDANSFLVLTVVAWVVGGVLFGVGAYLLVFKPAAAPKVTEAGL